MKYGPLTTKELNRIWMIQETLVFLRLVVRTLSGFMGSTNKVYWLSVLVLYSCLVCGIRTFSNTFSRRLWSQQGLTDDGSLKISIMAGVFTFLWSSFMGNENRFPCRVSFGWFPKSFSLDPYTECTDRTVNSRTRDIRVEPHSVRKSSNSAVN